MTDGLAFEKSLAWSAGRGNGEAVQELWRRHDGFLRAVVSPLAGNLQDAEDWVQDTWHAALRGFRSYRGTSAVRTWLYRLATNQSLQGLRVRRRVLPPFCYEEGISVQPEVAEFPAGALTLAIAGLPVRQRTVFELRAVEELPHTVIAARLGVSAVTSRTQYRKAQQKLRAKLGRLGAD